MSDNAIKLGMESSLISHDRDNLYLVYLDYNGILQRYPVRNNLSKLLFQFMDYWFVREVVGVYSMPPVTMEDVLVRKIQFKLKGI